MKLPRRWDNITKVSFLQRAVIINSILYYELDNPKMTDKGYDELCKQLVTLQKEINVDDTQYGYAFYDFDGSTGFDLYGRLNEKDRLYLFNIACHIGGKAKKEKPKKKKIGGLF